MCVGLYRDTHMQPHAHTHYIYMYREREGGYVLCKDSIQKIMLKEPWLSINISETTPNLAMLNLKIHLLYLLWFWVLPAFIKLVLSWRLFMTLRSDSCCDRIILKPASLPCLMIYALGRISTDVPARKWHVPVPVSWNSSLHGNWVPRAHILREKSK